MRYVLLLMFPVLLISTLQAQKRNRNNDPVYVDKQGVLRWRAGNREAAFFGVNYTVPFAYGYRSVRAQGVDPEKAIRDDVYHFARLGFDAFRVHVWDTELTDSLGNLKENEHLRLFDYLVQQLKARRIRIFLTPLAFWGNGYPERDVKTGSFSSIWNKQQVLVTEAAIQAQENYIRQLLAHVNPYTGLTYGQDPDVIALEVNNEPHHSGPLQGAADYIRRMVAAVRGSGWTKPVFYNISESPNYASAVANADIQGVSFQWYPTGLVANRSLQGNYLPHVSQYRIPFDTIPAFRNKARMVYEFDAGDVRQSVMYPAMARSFRAAGFQWATQFAYDPLATAYGNTEYQTHYVNLAYTPSKAISLMIAGEAFRRLPRAQSYGTYPQDTAFGPFRLSYENDLSEMNTAEAFYYSNSTATRPVEVNRLERLAGVGSSPLVRYAGTGAYFLDKLDNGVWRLEVMPDAVALRDPFERASPRKEVTRIQWQWHEMDIRLPGLGAGYSLNSIGGVRGIATTAQDGKVQVYPGVYLLANERAAFDSAGFAGLEQRFRRDRALGLYEFVAPPAAPSELFVDHQPPAEVSAGRPFTLTATITGLDTADRLSLELRHSAGPWKTLSLQPMAAYRYAAEVPADYLVPGLLEYRLLVQRPGRSFTVYPGAHTGDPYAWDNFTVETWQTLVAGPATPLSLFDPRRDRGQLNNYNPDWRRNAVSLTAGDRPGGLVWQGRMNEADTGRRLGWQLFVGDKLQHRRGELDSFDVLVVRARALGTPAPAVRLALISRQAAAFGAPVSLSTEFRDIEIPLSRLQAVPFLLLPRPYPGFHPLTFTGSGGTAFRLSDMEKLELTLEATGAGSSTGIEVGGVWLQKR